MSGPETALNADHIVDIGAEHQQEAESYYHKAIEVVPRMPTARCFMPA